MNPKDWRFDVLAIKNGVNTLEHCENWKEFQAASKQFLKDGYKTIVVYGYSDKGFEKKNSYVRGKEGTWLKLM